MRTLTRPDGTTYLASTRTTYLATGVFPAAVRGRAVAHLNGFSTALGSGLPLHEAIAALPTAARQAGAVAGALVQTFAAVTGVDPTLVMEEPLRVLDREDGVGLFADRHFPEAYADLADRVARSLGELLSALDATDVTTSNVD